MKLLLAALLVLSCCSVRRRFAHGADVYDAIEHRVEAALALRDAGHQVEAWFLLNQLVDVVLPLAQQGEPRGAAWLAVLGHRMGSLLIYFGAQWDAHPGTAAWDDGPEGDCLRLRFGLDHLGTSLFWGARSGRGHAFPYDQSRGLAQVARRKLRQQDCALLPETVLWPTR